MNYNQAQSSLEYLMTYGWALVMIISVISVLILVFNAPEVISFSSSDPTKILLKAGLYSNDVASFSMQNISGGKIFVKSVSGFGGGCTVNGSPVPAGGMDIVAGGEMFVNCEGVSSSDIAAPMVIEYDDYAGLSRTVSISSDVVSTSTDPEVVDDMINLSYGSMRFDRRTGLMSIDIWYENISETSIGSPMWAVVTTDVPQVTVANYDGTTSGGDPYYDVSGFLGDGQLDPDENVLGPRFYFVNPDRGRFEFYVTVRGTPLN